MRLSTLPICAILASTYALPISRKDDEEVPPGEERRGNKELAPPPKPEEVIIKLCKESTFSGETSWTKRDRGTEAFYKKLYLPNGRLKTRPKRR